MVLVRPAEGRPIPSLRHVEARLDLSVVIVSYNVAPLLRECLASVDANRAGLDLEVFVVDNASSDSSADLVAAEFPWARLIRSGRNLGFPRGANLGLREAAGRYLLSLNPDTRLPPGALAELVHYMDDHPELGAIGPKLVREDGSLDLACRRSFPSPSVAFYRLFGLARLFPRHPRFARYNLSNVDPDTPLDVDSVCGAFMMVRREAAARVGLFDESYWMYGEDLDWAFRIKRDGWRIRYHPAVVVLHHKRASSSQRPFRTLLAFYHAMHVFYRKHYAPTRPLLFNLLVHGAIHAYAGLALARNVLSPRNGARPS